MQQSKEDFQKTWAKIIAKAWSDPTFKEQLMKDPKSVLESHGVEISSDIHVVMVENTQNTFHLTLPEKPEGELSDEKLHDIAAGKHPVTVSIRCM